jgi:hypothetical protein
MSILIVDRRLSIVLVCNVPPDLEKRDIFILDEAGTTVGSEVRSTTYNPVEGKLWGKRTYAVSSSHEDGASWNVRCGV